MALMRVYLRWRACSVAQVELGRRGRLAFGRAWPRRHAVPGSLSRTRADEVDDVGATSTAVGEGRGVVALAVVEDIIGQDGGRLLEQPFGDVGGAEAQDDNLWATDGGKGARVESGVRARC